MEDDLKKYGRQPQKNGRKQNGRKIMEDDLKNKMEDEPINQNQPNWL